MNQQSRIRHTLWAAAALVAVIAGGYAISRLAGVWLAPLQKPRTTISADPVSLSPGPIPADDLRASLHGSNVVICVLDAARPDHIGCYGYPRETTPNIDRLADESVVFERHYCPYPMTKSSTASLFTGQHVDTHLAMELHQMAQGSFTMELGLARAGYHTAFFSSSGWASSSMGIGESFDIAYSPGARPRGPNPRGGHRDPQGSPGMPAATREAGDLLDAFSGWLAKRPDQPFFAYLHFLPPHHPYVAPEEMNELFAGSRPPNYRRGRLPFREIVALGGPDSHQNPGPELVNEYDANLRYADWALGEVLRLLREAGVHQETLFVFTADHGETFGEHGYSWHPSCPYDEALHIPLVTRFPGRGRPTGRIAALTSTVDILPTLYDLLDIAYPRTCVQGASLLPLLTGDAEKVHDYVVARTGGGVPCYMVRDLQHTLLLFEGGELRALYNVEDDPWQLHNIVGKEPEVANRLGEAFRRFAYTQTNPPLRFLDPDARPLAQRTTPEVELTDEMRKELEALGYLR